MYKAQVKPRQRKRTRLTRFLMGLAESVAVGAFGTAHQGGEVGRLADLGPPLRLRYLRHPFG